jgi:hypothetical protein
MKNELKILMHRLQDVATPLIREAEALNGLTVEERFEQGRKLAEKMEEVLQVKGPLYDLEAALDNVRFIVRKASEGREKLAQIA